MITGKITLDVDGLKQFTDQFQRRALKKAIRAGARLVQQAVKSSVPVRTGALRQSISTKVDSIKGKTFTYGVVGPRRKFVKANRKPGRYAHLANRKHQYLEKAWGGRRTQYLQAVKDVIASEINAILS